VLTSRVQKFGLVARVFGYWNLFWIPPAALDTSLASPDGSLPPHRCFITGNEDLLTSQLLLITAVSVLTVSGAVLMNTVPC
jgi:hypothetical protein